MNQSSSIEVKGSFEIIALKQGQEVWRSPIMENRVLNAGFALITAQHAGTANSLEITSLEIGDGSTAVTAGDTELDNMVLDEVPPAKVTPSTTSIVFEFFITDSELANGTYRELGLRAGLTLFTRALFSSAYTKVAGRDTIIRYTLSYSVA